jgi:hypothetical protein
MTPNGRLVALGASNLTRGLRVVAHLSRQFWGDPVEIVAALGHGRSYGMESAFLFRRLPGILQSGLWRHLETAEKAPARALVTDVGNDILYGAPVDEILGWVEECVTRLRAQGAEVVMTDLPLGSIDRLSSARFLLFRSVLVPSCRLSLAQVVDRSLAVEWGLRRLAERSGAAMVSLRPEWYGFDPIHIRPRLWGEAWREIFIGDREQAGRASLPSSRPLEWVRYYRAKPEQRRLLGVARRQSQPALALPGGTAMYLY